MCSELVCSDEDTTSYLYLPISNLFGHLQRGQSFFTSKTCDPNLLCLPVAEHSMPILECNVHAPFADCHLTISSLSTCIVNIAVTSY